MNTTGLARKMVERRRHRRDVKWRRVPRFKVSPNSGRQRIYYLCPMENAPSGGARVIYRHVDLLNNMGISAAVLHEKEGFSCDWFEHETPIVSAKELDFHQDDLLVLPECYGPGFHAVPDDIRKVVFNQGPHHTFDRAILEGTEPGHPYSSLKNLAGILSVSQDGAELLRMAFPDVEVSITRNVIDANEFRLRDDEGEKIISYVPSRRAEELHQVLHILRSNGQLDRGGWRLLPIHGRSEREMGDLLRSSAIFLSLSDRDGFGLPPAEAMATGCLVVGYTGGGGNEFFDPAFSRPATDTTGLVREILAAASLPGPERRLMGTMASAHVLSRYTEEGLRQDLKEFYGGVL